eukprot:TRINITY_DN25594_c0_g1_i1.p1 TRINITY_DN25594_c0_g1~~TRINITY_DN25594_c0_g1_i1.p1  ORF type:complete len:564 (+),score=119.84 TRINITY_DN25594_c0_g1_i1:69-1760(+)
MLWLRAWRNGQTQAQSVTTLALAAVFVSSLSVALAWRSQLLTFFPWRRKSLAAGECTSSSCCGSKGGSCGDSRETTTPQEAEVEDDDADLEDIAKDAPDADREIWGATSVKRTAKKTAPAADETADRSAMLPGKQRVFVKTYGCAHNNSDSEFMMGLLRDYGYTLTDAMDEADVCVVNSCTVKNPSQETAVTLTKKARGSGKPVILAGCVPSADSALVASLKDVSMLGVAQLDRVVEIVEESLQGNVVRLLDSRRAMPSLDLPKVRKNPFVEIIPISGGCLGNCSYCKTKHARGKLSSYTEDAIVNRALLAASEGVSEVWLTSEDTGAFGIDIGSNIVKLLNRVADAVPPGVMIKLGMTNPPYMLQHLDELVKVFKRPNVFEFIHIPVQSGSDEVLKHMVREYVTADFRVLADGLRASVPNILLATDIICGFPTESQEDHQESLDLVKEYKFPVLNIAQFYPRPGTTAARMKGLPRSIVKERSTEMTKLFDSYRTNDHLVGQTLQVWFCESDTRHNQTVGHTKGYVKVVVPRNDKLLGTSAMVRMNGATKWHVEGSIISNVAA